MYNQDERYKTWNYIYSFWYKVAATTIPLQLTSRLALQFNKST